MINVASIARDAGVARTTVAGYLEILEDTLLTFSLPAFEAKLRVRERKHPKLYWTDPGLPRAIKHQLGPTTAEERGPLLEGWIASVLRSYRDYRKLFDTWAYWAPLESTETEVDFVLTRGSEHVAIDVKSSPRAPSRALGGLRAVEGLRGLGRRILVFTGREALRTEDGIEVLPVGDFLKLLREDRLFP